MARRHQLAGVALALALTIAGCAGDSPSETTSLGGGVPDPADPVISVEIDPGTAEGFEGALADVTDHQCEPHGGAWHTSGTVTNPTDDPATYRIYTSFLSGGNDAVGVLQTDVGPVDPGESEEWEGTLNLSAGNLSCVLRVERTPVP